MNEFDDLRFEDFTSYETVVMLYFITKKLENDITFGQVPLESLKKAFVLLTLDNLNLIFDKSLDPNSGYEIILHLFRQRIEDDANINDAFNFLSSMLGLDKAISDE